MEKKKKEFRLGMFHKFTLVILVSGLVPMLILTTVLFRTMLVQYSRSFFADSSIHACLFRSLLLRFVSVP